MQLKKLSRRRAPTQYRQGSSQLVREPRLAAERPGRKSSRHASPAAVRAAALAVRCRCTCGLRRKGESRFGDGLRQRQGRTSERDSGRSTHDGSSRPTGGTAAMSARMQAGDSGPHPSSSTQTAASQGSVLRASPQRAAARRCGAETASPPQRQEAAAAAAELVRSHLHGSEDAVSHMSGLERPAAARRLAASRQESRSAEEAGHAAFAAE